MRAPDVGLRLDESRVESSDIAEICRRSRSPATGRGFAILLLNWGFKQFLASHDDS